MSIHSRSFAGEEDYARVRELLVELTADFSSADYCTVGDLDWWRSTDEDPDKASKMQLWFDGAELAGFVWPEADIIVGPEHVAVIPEMLAWAEDLSLQQSEVPEVTIETWSNANDAQRNEALQVRGYEQGEPAYRMRSIHLDGHREPTALPAGYSFRDMQNATAEDVQRRVDVHRAAFAPSKMTVGKHQRVMASPTYRPELDLVIVSDDGSFAAFTIIWFDQTNQIGVFEPLGTHPDHQRRGLGRAIIAEGLRRLSALDAKMAFINSRASDPASNGLYAAAGFQVVDEIVSWTKRLR